MSSIKDKVFSALKSNDKTKKIINIGLDSKIKYFVNTGHYGLNRVVSGMWHGGWASGKVQEVFGDPSTGKSILLVRAMVSLQNGEVLVMTNDIDGSEGFSILDDTEKAYNEDFCKMQGLNIKDVIRLNSSKTVESHFQQGEEAINTVRKVTKKSPLGVILDSIAQLSTKHEVKEGMDKRDMEKAQKIHQAMRIYSDDIYKHQLVYLIANHVTEKIGVMFGSKRAIKGGKGLAFQSSIRVDLVYKSRFVQNVMETEESGKRGECYGVRFIPTAVKNKVTMPFQFTVMDVYYDKGIDPYSGLFDYFLRKGQITIKAKATGGKKPKPAVYSFNKEKDFHREGFDQFIIDNDILDLKKHKIKYMKPLDKSEYTNYVEEDIETPVTKEAPVAPPPAGMKRESKKP